MNKDLNFVTTKILNVEKEQKVVNFLDMGDIIEEGDLFLSTSGMWEPTPVYGHKVIDNGVKWARPINKANNEEL